MRREVGGVVGIFDAMNTPKRLIAVLLAVAVLMSPAVAAAATPAPPAAPAGTEAGTGQIIERTFTAAGMAGSGRTIRMTNQSSHARWAYIKLISGPTPVGLTVTMGGESTRFRYAYDCLSVRYAAGSSPVIRITNRQDRLVSVAFRIGWYRYTSGCGLG